MVIHLPHSIPPTGPHGPPPTRMICHAPALLVVHHACAHDLQESQSGCDHVVRKKIEIMKSLEYTTVTFVLIVMKKSPNVVINIKI